MLNAVADRAAVVNFERTQGTTIRLVPIVGPSHADPEYELLGPKTSDRVRIAEVSASGVVPEAVVHNDLDRRLFLMEGQELIGAKQNRIMNTDVLVPPKSQLKIPVSCVEQGRWRANSEVFTEGGSASPRVRYAAKTSVTNSLKACKTFQADQDAVWEEVEQALAIAGADDSDTRALSDAFTRRHAEMERFRAEVQMPADAVGLAVFQGTQLQGIDLFDRHSTLRYMWDKLIDSYIVDAPETGRGTPAVTTDDAAREIKHQLLVAAAAPWQSFDSPGEGTDWRLDDARMIGSTLIWHGQVLVHLHLMPRQGQPVHARPRSLHARAGRSDDYIIE